MVEIETIEVELDDPDLDSEQILDIKDRIVEEVKKRFGENYELVDYRFVIKVKARKKQP